LEQIDALKQAGADEIKLNIETFDRGIFEKVCGGQDLDWILQTIEHAVEVFGRGKVTSNIIVGLGENDESVIAGIETLARMGCVVTLRPLKTNDLNRNRLKEALGEWDPLTEERLMRLVSKQKEILARHGLSTLTFQTMCHACTCCDIVPFKDL
jgi:biotin synthase-related radical SAM superfamily protein